jgi:bifunctional non-homologous end joining protein LigD
VKSKCLNREEFVVVGWTGPEGSRFHIGALLLGYYTDDRRLLYAGRAGTGMAAKELKRLAGVLAPLQVPKMPLASRRRAIAASARRSSCHASTGCGRRWSWK